jgi:putative pyruvate formate lyase activating enzyme
MRLSDFPVYLGVSERVLNSCTLCGHECKVDRIYERGVCDSGMNIKISSIFPHFGEEPPLVGTHGSGTIFLSNCNCKCVYCQNFHISHLGEGKETSKEDIVGKMIYLQKIGCHNVNWVSPTHFAPQLVESLFIARERGFKLPVVYNTGGYDSPDLIKTLEGIIDIYMPDIKYGNNKNGLKYSGIKGYWDIVRSSVKEMHSQVGDLMVDNCGIAKRGLIIRHLVLPGNVAGSEEVLKFIADGVSRNSYVNIMNQYMPYFRALEYKELGREITPREYINVLNKAKELGLSRALSR